MKKKLQLIEVALADAGYTSATLEMEGNVCDVRTDDGEQFNILLFERSIKRMHDDYFYSRQMVLSQRVDASANGLPISMAIRRVHLSHWTPTTSRV